MRYRVSRTLGRSSGCEAIRNKRLGLQSPLGLNLVGTSGKTFEGLLSPCLRRLATDAPLARSFARLVVDKGQLPLWCPFIVFTVSSHEIPIQIRHKRQSNAR